MTTTTEKVKIYEKAVHVFAGVVEEIAAHARKKPESALNPAKVKIINTLLADLLVMLKDEPDSSYLSLLDLDDIPSYSDASLMLAQFTACVEAFRQRHQTTSEELLGLGMSPTWSVSKDRSAS
jgi:hypothetical protein